MFNYSVSMQYMYLIISLPIYIDLLFRSDSMPFVSSLMHTGCNKTIPWGAAKEKSGEVAEGTATHSFVTVHLMGVIVTWCCLINLLLILILFTENYNIVPYTCLDAYHVCIDII